MKDKELFSQTSCCKLEQMYLLIASEIANPCTSSGFGTLKIGCFDI